MKIDAVRDKFPWSEYEAPELGEEVARIVSQMIEDKTGALRRELEETRRELAFARLRIEELEGAV